MVKQMTLELKVDAEVNVSLVSNRREHPSVCQVLKRPFDGTHQQLSRSVQRDLARETLLERTKADDEVGDDLSLVLAMDTRAAAPGHEQRIVLHVRHDREKLVSAIAERSLFLVTRHITLPHSCAVPAKYPTVGTNATSLRYIAAAQARHDRRPRRLGHQARAVPAGEIRSEPPAPERTPKPATSRGRFVRNQHRSSTAQFLPTTANLGRNNGMDV
jgi:hypothetical protein